MTAVEEKDRNQQDERDPEPGKNYSRLAQLAIIRFHQQEHPADSERDVNQLPDEENVRVAVQVARRDGRGAEYHHGAEQTHRQRCSEELTIGLQAAWHSLTLSVRNGIARNLFG